MIRPKQTFWIAPVLLAIVAAGCSKGPLNRDAAEFDSRYGMDSSLERVDDSFGEVASAAPEAETGREFGSAPQGMPSDGATGSFAAEPFAQDRGTGIEIPQVEAQPGRDFGGAAQGMPGDGSTGSFAAEPFDGDRGGDAGATAGSPDGAVADGGDAALPGGLADSGEGSFAFEKPGTGQEFGGGPLGMPGDGSTGSFAAEPFAAGPGGEPGGQESEVASSDLFQGQEPGGGGGFEKPGTGREFGGGPLGMPGDGSTGSFAAEPFDGDRGGDTGRLPAEEESASAGRQLFTEEDIDESGSGGGYEKPGPGPDFGSAEQGMPGDGSTGSFAAEPFVPEETAKLEPMTRQEEVRRFLPYRASDSLQDIHFAFDRHDLDDKSKEKLRKNAAYLMSYPNLKIEVEGHCDERGSNSYNISLGERRARATKSFLVFLGVDESRIRTISYGEERPFCTESNELCWYKNRRAHFLVAE